MNTSFDIFVHDEVFEDAQGFLEAGKYQEAPDILDRRIKCVHEMPKSRLVDYYCARALCLAHLGNIAKSIRLRLFLYQRKKSFGKVYSWPETYLAFVLKQSGFQIGSRKFIH